MASINVTYNPYKVAFWVVVVIFGVLLLSFFKGCFTPNPVLKPTVVVKSDTVVKVVQSAAPIQPPTPIVISTQQPSVGQTNTIREIIYRNDTAAIRVLLNQFYSQNVSKERLPLDSNGYVEVTDTVSQNKIAGRSYTYSIKAREITNTVTITQPAIVKTQWLYGFGGSGSFQGQFKSVDAGIGVINKKGQMIQIHAEMFNNITFGGRIGYSHKF